MGFLSFFKLKKKNRVIFDTQPISPEEKKECEAASDTVEQNADAVCCEEHCECEANENGIFEVKKCCDENDIVEETQEEEVADVSEEFCQECCEECSGVESSDDYAGSGCDCSCDCGSDD